jgi:hypothetical protein
LQRAFPGAWSIPESFTRALFFSGEEGFVSEREIEKKKIAIKRNKIKEFFTGFFGIVRPPDRGFG